MRDAHVDPDLSAYLDAELLPAERDRVQAHLASCEQCRARLADLTATARLVAALPSPWPARSLVPRVTERWNGLRLLRSASAIASGAFLFAFLVTAVGRTGTGLGGGDASTAIFGGGAAAPAASWVSQATAAARDSAPSAAPSAPALAVPAATGASAGGAQSPAPAKGAGTSPAPQFFAPAPQAAATAPAGDARSIQTPIAVRATATQPLREPLFWLGLAALAGLAALGAHLRLRTR